MYHYKGSTVPFAMGEGREHFRHGRTGRTREAAQGGRAGEKGGRGENPAKRHHERSFVGFGRDLTCAAGWFPQVVALSWRSVGVKCVGVCSQLDDSRAWTDVEGVVATGSRKTAQWKGGGGR